MQERQVLVGIEAINKPARQANPIAVHFERLVEKLGVLDRDLADLINVLEPVLGPPLSENGVDPRSGGSKDQSALANSIEREVDTLQSLINAVNNTRARVEL